MEVDNYYLIAFINDFPVKNRFEFEFYFHDLNTDKAENTHIEHKHIYMHIPHSFLSCLMVARTNI